MLQRPGGLQRLGVLRVEHRLHIFSILVQPSVEEGHPDGEGLLDAALVAVLGEYLKAMRHKVLFLVQTALFESIGLAGLILMSAAGLGGETQL